VILTAKYGQLLDREINIESNHFIFAFQGDRGDTLTLHFTGDLKMEFSTHRGYPLEAGFDLLRQLKALKGEK
jgi:hypothetical protein